MSLIANTLWAAEQQYRSTDGKLRLIPLPIVRKVERKTIYSDNWLTSHEHIFSSSDTAAFIHTGSDILRAATFGVDVEARLNSIVPVWGRFDAMSARTSNRTPSDSAIADLI